MQLLAIVLLWLAFLVTQQQKAGHNRCSLAFLGWFSGQAIVLGAATGLGILHQVRSARGNADDLDPEMREILLGHPRSEEPTGEAHGNAPFQGLPLEQHTCMA